MSESLTTRLARTIARDNAILFVGAGLAAPDDPSPLQQLAEALAARIKYDRPDRSLPAVARDFELLRGRNELVVALREETKQLGEPYRELYQLIADAALPQTKLITTRFDQRLEEALRQFQKRFVLIVRDTDVPAFDESLITLIKLHGDLDQPDSLIITEDDLDAFIDRLPTISDVIRAFLATKTLIFLGYDLDSDLFKRLFRQMTRNLTAFQRPAYAVVGRQLDEVEVRYWQRYNVEIVAQPPRAFLEALASAVKAATQAEPEPARLRPAVAEQALPPHPYKGLASYTEADAAIFAGRATESERLANRILGHRLTILYGESGSGKTSLLRAGVAPLLARQQALLAITAPAPDQPLTQLLRRSLADAGRQAGVMEADAANLLVMIRQWQPELAGPIVLVIDQFEQFFLAYRDQARRAGVGFLQEMLADRSLNLRLVLIVREDFLGRLQSLEEEIAGLLDIRFRLERLGREAAASAIEDPARPYGVAWERGLVQQLLDQLYAGDRGGVSPPQLQIVCQRLYEAAVTDRPEQATTPVLITPALLESLGGTAAILGDYLDRVVAGFDTVAQPSVRLLLGALVSSGGVKVRLPLAELARTAELDREAAAPLLDRLAGQRLLRRYEVVVAQDEPPRLEYELTHDYLAERILLWLGEEFWSQQKAREILRHAVPEWETRQRLLGPDDLRLVLAQASRLQLQPEEQALVYASAVAFDQPAGLEPAGLEAAARRAILQPLLAHPDGPVRRQAAVVLAHVGGAKVPDWLAEQALLDQDAGVRQAIVEALAPVVDAEALRRLTSAVAATDTAAAAREALVWLRDRRPAIHHQLPADLRDGLQRQVWRRRWDRRRADILAAALRGVQGGFWGMALGPGLFLGLSNALAAGSSLTLLAQRPETIIQLASVGAPLAGAVGAAVGGGGGLAAAVGRALPDFARPWRTWAVTVAVATAVMGAGFVLLAAIFAGDVQPGRSVAAGWLVGLLLAGTAAFPWRTALSGAPGLDRFLAPAAAVAAGAVTFPLAAALGLVFITGSGWWLPLMGAVAGAGFYWGLAQPQSEGL